MPQTLKCFCDSAGCVGHEVSKRVFDAHSRLDHAAQAHKLLEASERVLKDQDEALSACQTKYLDLPNIQVVNFGPNHLAMKNQLRRSLHIMKELADVNSPTVTYNFFEILKFLWRNSKQMRNIN